MGRKAFLQIGGAILLGLDVAIPMVLDARDIFPQWQWQYHALIGFFFFAGFMTWVVWDKQKQINASQVKIRFFAKPGFLAINHPMKSEQPLARDEVSINTTILFEIWTDVDVNTAHLALNVVGVRRIRWWQPWKLFLSKYKRLRGIPMEEKDTTSYRRQIKCTDTQPFEDQATFKWRGKKEAIFWGDSFRLELALETGSPKGKWRTLIDPHRYQRGVIKAI